MSEKAVELENDVEPPVIDGGNVILLVGDPENEMVPVPLPVVFQQLFKVLNDLDARLTALDGGGVKEEKRIITV